MSLKLKTLVTLGLTMFAGLVVVAVFAGKMLFDGFDNVQRQACEMQLYAAVQSLADQVKSLDLTTLDWADWQDMYNFVSGANPTFAADEIDGNTFHRLELDLLAILDRSGRLAHVSKKTLINPQGRLVDLAGILDVVQRNELLCHCLSDEFKGLLIHEETPFLFAARPVTDGNGMGPVNGTLVMVRKCEPEKLKSKSGSATAQIEFQIERKPTVNVIFPLGHSSLQPSTINATANTVVSKGAVIDVLGNTSGVITASMSRELYWAGRNRSVYLLGSFALTAALFVLVSLWFVQRTVLKPVSTLKATVNEIKQRGDLSVRVPVTTKDEIGSLARHFNDMLANQESAQREANQLNQKLASAIDKANKANRHKTRFLASMSHELRTPLNGILGYADLLGKRFFGDLNDKQLDYVQRIDACGKHLLELINELLDMAKIDAGKMELQASPFAPQEVVEESLAVMSALFEEKAQVVSVRYTPELSDVMGDRGRCVQIMLNLLSNANKYTDKNGLVDVHVELIEDFVRFSVSDNGVGIPLEDQGQVFSEFFQVEKLTERALRGTGIGLALTRRLVQLHGGQIGLSSTPGQGSTFWFTLPKARPAPAAIAKTANASTVSKSSNGSLRVLVAEDNEANRIMVCDMLTALGHKVISVTTGKDAIAAAEAHLPDLILMDMRMPEMDGLEATRLLRQRPWGRDVPIIALTASVGPDAKAVCMSAGCSGFLSKPIQVDDLHSAIQNSSNT